MALLRARPAGDVSVSEIAREAGVYPNQITHHFGSKDALFVEAAFTLLLQDAERLQSSARRMRTPEAFSEAIARTALVVPSIPLVVRALAVASGNAALHGKIQSAMSILFRQSERFLERTLVERGWVTSHGVERDVRTFWSAVFGAVLMSRAGVPGGPSDIDVAATLTIGTA